MRVGYADAFGRRATYYATGFKKEAQGMFRNKTLKKINKQMEEALSADQQADNSLTKMFDFVEVVEISGVPELVMEEDDKPAEEVLRACTLAAREAIEVAYQTEEAFSQKEVYRRAALEYLGEARYSGFLMHLEQLEQGPLIARQDFAKALALAKLARLVPATCDDHLATVFSWEDAIVANQGALSSGKIFGEPSMAEEIDGTLYDHAQRMRGTLQSMLDALKPEVVVHQFPGEDLDEYVERCIWTLQQIALEIDQFFPLHRDPTDYGEIDNAAASAA